MAADLDMGADSQDMAEVYDETNITEDGDDIAHPDMERDVFDVTSAADDADDDDFEADDDEDFDPDQADDAEIDGMMEEDDGVESPRSLGRDPTDVVTGAAESPADYEAEWDGNENEETGEREADTPSPEKQRELDHGLEETFPASDPVSINPGAD